MELSVINYDSKSAQINRLSGVGELAQYKKKSGIVWINVGDLKDVDAIKGIGELFNIHQLTIEDIFITEQPPKVETSFKSPTFIHTIPDFFLYCASSPTPESRFI